MRGGGTDDGEGVSRTSRASTWREVERARLGFVDGPHCTRGQTWVAWTNATSMAGIFATEAQRVEEIEPALDAILSLPRRIAPASLLIDTRRFGADVRVLVEMMRHVHRVPVCWGGLLRRVAYVLPEDWSLPWWRGVIELDALRDTGSVRAFVDEGAAWEWLGATGELRASVCALRAPIEEDPRTSTLAPTVAAAAVSRGWELRDREHAQLAELLERIAGRTHDLGGPGLALGATLETLSAVGRALPHGLAALIDRAQRDAELLVAMIHETKREFRRAVLPDDEPVQLEAVVREICARAHARFPALRIEAAPTRGLVLRVRGGEVALMRVLENLVMNSCAVASRVEVSVCVEPSTISIRVEDDGPGISADHEPAPTRGLGSVKRIVETSGGTLSFGRSAVLGGAQVRVQLLRERV